jgi:predicted amidophosphoribosyltransferase
MIKCRERRVNDEVFCDSCAKVWAVDETKPECNEKDQNKRKIDSMERRNGMYRNMIKVMRDSLSC